MFDIVTVAGIVITVVTGVPVFLQLRNHPRGLAVLFFAEMWERFSYYGMRGLLIFYLTEHFLFDDTFANGQYAAYTTLVYLLPLVGGFVADRWLGSRKAIAFGALLLVAGHFTMALEGPPATETLTYQGHTYSYRIEGRMTDRKVCLEVGTGCYAFHGDDQQLVFEGLPATAPLPQVLPKGSYADRHDRSQPFVDVLYLALSLIIMGVGFLKANISSIVGQLYPQGDPRRDPGFTLYYYGINLGAFWAAILCGALGQSVGWGAGFGLAGVGMLAGYLVFVFNRKRLEGKGEPPKPEALKAAVIGPLRLEWVIYLAALVGVAAVWGMVRQYELMGALLGVGWIIALAYLVLEAIGGAKMVRERLAPAVALSVAAIRGGKEVRVRLKPAWSLVAETFRSVRVVRERLMLAVILVVGSMIFFALAEQAGSSLNQFAERNAALPNNGFWSLTPAQTQSFNSGYILIFAPILSYIWARLGRAGRDPNPLLKFGLGLIQIGLGFLVLVWSATYADASFRTPLIFLAFSYLLQTTGELFVSPVGLSEMTKLAPARMISTMMAIWFLGASGAEWVAGLIARTTAADTVGGQVLDPAKALATYSHTFMIIGAWGCAAGVLFIAASPWLKKWAHGADDTSVAAEIAAPAAAAGE